MMRSIQLLLILMTIYGGRLIAQDLTSGYLHVGNDSIFYETSGSGEAIIFIHDGLIHRELYDEQFSYFGRDYKVIRYDRRGYGNSSPASEGYSNVEDLKNLLAALEIEHASLIAASSGGRLAIDFALRYPENVNSLVLVGAVVGGFSYTDHFYTRGGHLPTDLQDPQQRFVYYVKNDPYEIYKENKAAKEKAYQLIVNNPKRRIHHTNAKPENSKPTPSYQRLNEIDIPTLILVGEYDIPDVHAHAGVINAGIKHSERKIIPNSGHLIPLEQPDLFNLEVSNFIESYPDKTE